MSIKDKTQKSNLLISLSMVKLYLKKYKKYFLLLFVLLIGLIAEDVYNAAKNYYKDPAEALYNKGVQYEEQGNNEKALEYIEEAITLNPDYYQAYFKKGLIYGYKGDEESLHRSVKDYKNALRSEDLTQKYEAYSNLIGVYANLNKTSKAINAFNQAIKLPIKDKDLMFAPYAQIGWMYFKLKEYNKAIEYFEKSIEILPHPDNYNGLGRIYNALEEYDKAEHYYKKAIELDSNNSSVMRDLVNNYIDSKNYKVALTYKEKLISLANEQADTDVAYYIIADAYGAIGEEKQQYTQCKLIRDDELKEFCFINVYIHNYNIPSFTLSIKEMLSNTTKYFDNYAKIMFEACINLINFDKNYNIKKINTCVDSFQKFIALEGGDHPIVEFLKYITEVPLDKLIENNPEFINARQVNAEQIKVALHYFSNEILIPVIKLQPEEDKEDKFLHQVIDDLQNLEDKQSAKRIIEILSKIKNKENSKVIKYAISYIVNIGRDIHKSLIGPETIFRHKVQRDRSKYEDKGTEDK